jgi:membrane associated rhomboid family serine protease
MDQIFISYFLIGISVIVSLKGFNDRSFMERFSCRPFNIKHYNQYYRLITHQFLHVNPMHLIFNMIGLYYFGRVVEIYFTMDFGPVGGGILYVVFYLLGGIFATLIPFIRHKDHEFYSSVGASGAIAAVIFAGIIFWPMMPMGLIFLPVMLPAYIFGPLYLVIEIIADRYAKSNIAHDAHIGGALFGILFVLITNIDRVKMFVETLVNQ